MITFKSKSSPAVMMYQEHAERILEVLNKSPERGVITAAEAPGVLALLEKDPSQARDLMHAARRLIFSRGKDSHDYKFSSAVLEDYYAVAPALRPRFMATAMFSSSRSAGAPSCVPLVK